MTPVIGHRVPAVLKAWERTLPSAEGHSVPMGETLNCLCAAAAACAAAICLSGTASAQSQLPSPSRDAGARRAAQPTGAIGAPGVVIRYEEVASSGVIYLEESGGMVSSVTSPVKAARAPAPPAAPAPAAVPVDAATTAAPTKVAQRRPTPEGPGRP